jgi:hypothetical protein
MTSLEPSTLTDTALCGCDRQDPSWAAVWAADSNLAHFHADGSRGEGGPDGATSQDAQIVIAIFHHDCRPRGWR